VLGGSGEFGALAVALLGLAVPSALPAEGVAVVEGDDGASVVLDVAAALAPVRGARLSFVGALVVPPMGALDADPLAATGVPTVGVLSTMAAATGWTRIGVACAEPEGVLTPALSGVLLSASV
jgi:hypothetical protein